MAVSELEAVLEFLRKNGFPEAESALRKDVDERNQLDSLDFEEFMLPMPPPVGVPSGIRSTDIHDEVSGGSRSKGGDSSSDVEFVSLLSSTSGVCSSGFVNPYGVPSSSQVGSEASSSDRLSQFETARAYLEPNKLYFQDNKFDDNEDDFFLTSAFRESEFFVSLTEDKFIMTSETEDQQERSQGIYDQSEGSQAETCIDLQLTSKNQVDDNEIHVKDYYPSELEVRCNYKDPWDYSGKGFQTNGLDGYEHGDGLEAGEVNDSNVDKNENNSLADEHLDFGADADEYDEFDLRIIHRKNRTGFEEDKELQIVQNTVIGGRYYVTEYIGSAAFSKVVLGHDCYSGIDVCLKIIKNNKDFFDQSLSEIKLLMLVNKHDPGDEHHILRLYDYFYYREHLFIVCELLQANLYEFQKFNQESGGKPYFNLIRLQLIARQCLEALEFLHGLGIIHCDLKPENILIKSYEDCEIKIIDLGSSCFRTDNLCLYVQSRSYRAPEVILGLPYDEKIDLWSLGCILAELLSGKVLFPNEAMVMILAQMIGISGPIALAMLETGRETSKYFTEEYNLYHVNEKTGDMEYITPERSCLEDHIQVSDDLFVDFVRTLLEINPERRPTAREALNHPWLSSYPI